MITVLFVCLGNICRSPMAEGVFQQLVLDAGLGDNIKVDSAGTGAWHIGEEPHRGTQQILQQHHIRYSGRARQISAADMQNENAWIIVMDQSNMDNLQHRYGVHPRLHRLLEFAAQHNEEDVPDPYYHGGFDYVYELVLDGCKGLLDAVRAEI